MTVDVEANFPANSADALHQWIDAIDPVLAAVGQFKIGSDDIDCLYLTKDWLHITTEFYTRGCVQRNDINVPVFVLKAEDPIREATIYVLQKKLSGAKWELSIARDRVAAYTDRVANLEKDLEALMQNERFEVRMNKK